MCIIINLQNKKIKIDDGIVKLISCYKQIDRKDCEAGGILIGRENKETGNLIVEYATEPYDKDKRKRMSFYRKDKKHIDFYNKLYEDYTGIYAYIGEWHSHPEDYPNYSSIDINNWKKISKINVDKEKIYYHLIVGNKEIRVWEYHYNSKLAKRIY
ncbi:Mov34/MPN/PAD-1 family protein [Clostridium sp.]|jgi:integrative and conjugative element protein (TIGR02256 family)|uniref:Mov34/MPN/PAD-1 family protein n=1 Tax=Clostridium sp. TaxID=1506 RepID=UPI003EEB8FF7